MAAINITELRRAALKWTDQEVAEEYAHWSGIWLSSRSNRAAANKVIRQEAIKRNLLCREGCGELAIRNENNRCAYCAGLR